VTSGSDILPGLRDFPPLFIGGNSSIVYCLLKLESILKFLHLRTAFVTFFNFAQPAGFLDFDIFNYMEENSSTKVFKRITYIKNFKIIPVVGDMM